VGTYSAYYRAVAAVGNEPEDYTWTNTGGSSRAVAVMFRVTGANNAAPIAVFGAMSTVGTVAVTAPGLTTDQDNTLLVACWEASRAGTPVAIDPPDPMISVAEVSAAPASSSTLHVAVTPRGDAGEVASKTATIQPTASSATAFMLAIAPAPPTTPTTEFPTVRLEVAFEDGAGTGTGLTLDDPSRGKLDAGTLGGGSTSAPVWTDLRAWLRSATINRGSSRVDAPIVTYEAGQLTAVLDDVDGRFDPNNLTGPYTEETTQLSGERVTLNANSDFESGTGGWTGFGCTFTQANDQVYAGSWSGKLVPTGTDLFVSIDSDPVAVTEGYTYTGRARVRCAQARNILIKIDWYSVAGGPPMSSSFSTYIALAAGTWTPINFTAVAPPGAVTATFVPLMDGTPPVSHVLWVDEAELAHMPYKRATQLTAMRAVRVMAEWDGITYELWRGFADQWEPSYSPGSAYSECTLTATDASKVLAGIDRTALTVPVGGGEDSGARVDRILNSAGWPAGDRLVAAGDSTLQPTPLEGDAWAELQTVSQSELGEVYIDGGGRLVFRNRLAYLTDARSNTSQGTFGDSVGELSIEDLATSSDDATFFNEVAVTRAGGVEQVAEDLDSQELYYRKTYRPPAEPLLETDEAALGYAHWLLHIASEPELRFTELTTNPAAGPADLWPHALGREIGDRITVRRRPPPDQALIERQSFIRGVRHEFTDESWKTTWTLQDATRYGSFFVLDHPELGVLDFNALAY
jgi:hypothetical protein